MARNGNIFQSLKVLFVDLWWVWAGMLVVCGIAGAIAFVLARYLLGVR